MRQLRFYNVKTREFVEVSDDQVKVVTMSNGKPAVQAEVNGVKLFKIVSKADALRLSQ